MQRSQRWLYSSLSDYKHAGLGLHVITATFFTFAANSQRGMQISAKG